MSDEETIEERIRRYAYNRWEARQKFKFRLEDTDKDDWKIAEEIVRREIFGSHSRDHAS